jgi:pyruvate/2-oxoglutarate dehydrogenase complex dihydrolipoamide acyltransferase (E2) component
MATEIKMPQLGESVVEGTITKWLKQEGDTVGEDELLVEVSTDKVDSEVPSSAAGVIQKILVPEGETVQVGVPIAVVGEAGETESDGADQETSDASEASAEGSEERGPEAREASESPPSQEEEAGEPSRPAATAEKAGDDAARPERPSPGRDDGDTSKRGIISPLVRRLADEHGVDLDAIDGTGTGGRIRKQDVLKFVEQQKAKPEAKPAAAAEPAPEKAPAAARAEVEREELVPWTNIRRRTAEHMIASHLETARAWNAVEVDWTNVGGLRTEAKSEFKRREGFSLTYMPFLAKALCDSLLEMPVVNSTYDESQQGNVHKHYVNLGIAVALEGGGLIVPVIKGADEKNLVGLARAVRDVATRAQNKKLVPDDLVGGTFSITNPGPFGSIISVPIIPRSQTAILGFEAIVKRVVVREDDSLAIRHIGVLDLSWDHRAIDGAEAARFLALLKERIETKDFSGDLQQYL